MRKTIAKKTIILYVLKMLKEGSSKDKPLTASVMAKTLNSLGIPCDRKTIGRNIGYLIDFGYVIDKSSKGYYFIGEGKVCFGEKN